MASFEITKLSGAVGWATGGKPIGTGTATGVLRSKELSLKELTLDVTYEGSFWSGKLTFASGFLTGVLTPRPGSNDGSVSVRGRIFRNPYAEEEWLFFGEWIDKFDNVFWAELTSQP
jgi:hypothetical protein